MNVIEAREAMLSTLICEAEKFPDVIITKTDVIFLTAKYEESSEYTADARTMLGVLELGYEGLDDESCVTIVLDVKITRDGVDDGELAESINAFRDDVAASINEIENAPDVPTYFKNVMQQTEKAFESLDKQMKRARIALCVVAAVAALVVAVAVITALVL